MIVPSAEWNKKVSDEEYPVRGLPAIESKAVRGRWSVPQAAMKEIMEHQVAIATDDDSSNKDKIGSAKTVIQMVAQDRQEEVMSANSINIAGSVVIGSDAISAAISSRMAIEAAD